jgi:hypothetical protein
MVEVIVNLRFGICAGEKPSFASRRPDERKHKGKGRAVALVYGTEIVDQIRNRLPAARRKENSGSKFFYFLFLHLTGMRIHESNSQVGARHLHHHDSWEAGCRHPILGLRHTCFSSNGKIVQAMLYNIQLARKVNGLLAHGIMSCGENPECQRGRCVQDHQIHVKRK